MSATAPPFQPLVPDDANLSHLRPGGGHEHCLREAPAEYPARAAVDPNRVSWSVDWREYRPPTYESSVVRDHDRTHTPSGWADPPDLALARSLRHFTSNEPFGSTPEGMPLNPRGRTGLAGRGLLGNFGANYAGDALVTRINPKSGQLEMIVVRRKDSHQWAIPGGMVDAGESGGQTHGRELREETGVDLPFARAHLVYHGYCDDRRNTDNAWMESTVLHCHIEDPSIEPRVVDPNEVEETKWMPVHEALGALYASHGDFVRQAVLDWQQATGHKVGADSRVTD
jgi:ADP-ribose pyrophosphatase